MPLHRRLLPILAMLTVACAQIFGLQQGYLCDLGGRAVRTMVDHHHAGDDLHAWHLDEAVPHQHQGEDDHGTVPHAPLKVDLDVPQLPGAMSAPAVVLWEERDWLQTILMGLDIQRPARAMGQEPLERPPAAALVVAKSVVLRV